VCAPACSPLPVFSFNVQQDGVSAGSQRFVPVHSLPRRRYARAAVGRWRRRRRARSRFRRAAADSLQRPGLLAELTWCRRGPLSYLTLWPTGQGQPLVSTLNSFCGIVVANAAIVPAGFNGAVSMYVTDPTDVILDIDGYFDAAGTYAFYPVQPCRGGGYTQRGGALWRAGAWTAS